ncbi:MAG: heavy-metal-associated domain-containing protein [Lysobacteraceae bacterium]|jgi:copper chaperone CopZ
MKRFALSLMLTIAAGTASATTLKMEVNGLVCAFCANGITQTFTKKPEVAAVHVSLEDRLVAIGLKEGHDLSDAAVTESLKEAGYTVVSIERTEQSVADIKAEVERGG